MAATVLLLGLIVPTPAWADPTAPPSVAPHNLPSTVSLDGVLLVRPIEPSPMRNGEKSEPMPSGRTVELFTESGASVELTGTAVATARSGDRFHGTVAVDQLIATAVAKGTTAAPTPREPADWGELVADASAALKKPLRVVKAKIESVSQPAGAAKAHTVDVMYVHAADQNVPSVSYVDAMVARLGEFWSSQSDGQVSGINRPLAMKTATVAAARLCDKDWLWDYASGPDGFNRAPAFSGGPLDSYYWAGAKAAHLIILVPGDTCGAGNGLGSIGRLHAGGTVWASIPADSMDWDQVVFHEVGHNLGLKHSNTTQCPEPAVEGPTCEQSEYSDYYDVMGGGYSYRISTSKKYTNERNVAALKVTQKVLLGALPRSSALREVTSAGGTTQRFTLAPASATSGVRGLEVIDPLNNDKLYVEYRSGTGRDAQSFYTQYSAGNTRDATYAPGVRVLRIVPDSRASTSTVLMRWQGGRASLSYRAGDDFLSLSKNPGGTPSVRIAVVSTSTSGATVEVTLGTPPVASRSPVISGSPQVGSTLTVIEGSWTIGTRFSYQWAVAGIDVAGATGRTFVPRRSDVGSTVVVKVTGAKDGYTSVATTSAATAAVSAGALKVATPTVSGKPRIGATLTAVTGGWDPAASLAYQWLVSAKEVAGATLRTFVPRASDLGRVVAVRVTGTRAGFNPVARTSAATAKVLPMPSLSTHRPSVSGTPRIGVSLTARRGTWTSGTVFRYQWLVAGKAVPAATTSTFVPRASDKGKRVTVKVTGAKPGYKTASSTSKSSSKVRPLLSMKASTPKVLGTAKVGAVLTAKPGKWTSGSKLTYQWLAGGLAVPGATASRFVLRTVDVGLAIKVRVTGSKPGYKATSRTSKATRAVIG